LSQHRRRHRARRGGGRAPGFLLPVTAMAVAAIAGITASGYLVARSDHSGAGAALAAALQPAGQAISALERQRQQLIVMDTASHMIHLVHAPRLASRPVPGSGGISGGGGVVLYPPPNPGTAQAIAYSLMPSFGFDPKTQFGCLNDIWTRESGWRYNAENASGAYGIPQALPGDKMASAGPDWQTDPRTQIEWGLGYIKSTYGTPCNAWAFWQAHDYY
jgi:hypothetical protein